MNSNVIKNMSKKDFKRFIEEERQKSEKMKPIDADSFTELLSLQVNYFNDTLKSYIVRKEYTQILDNTSSVSEENRKKILKMMDNLEFTMNCFRCMYIDADIKQEVTV